MKILVALNSFKDFASAKKVGVSITNGLKRKTTNFPVADGGDGTIHAIESALKCKSYVAKVTGPLYSMKIKAKYIMFKKTAVIEMNSASGLHLLTMQQRNPLKTTTYGFGQLINDAISNGANRLILCIGGSATVDCGIGMMAALGAKFWSGKTQIEKPTGADLERITGMILPKIRAEIIVASDVNSRYSNIKNYIEQKTVRDKKKTKTMLLRGLKHFSSVVNKHPLETVPGTGAAGGLGYGLLLIGAKIRPGFKLVADLIGLEKQIIKHDVIITGEGGFDQQTYYGKAPIGVAKLCKKHLKKCLLIAGYSSVKKSKYFHKIISLQKLSIEEIKRKGHANMRSAAQQAIQYL